MTEEELMDVPITPLGVAIDGPGKYRTARSVHDLANFLIGQWPGEKGDVWRAAVAACLRAFEAQINGDAARAAFVMAANEIDLPLIVNADNLWPRGAPRDPPKKMPAWKRKENRARH